MKLLPSLSFHVIFNPKAIIFPFPFHSLIFFPNRLDKPPPQWGEGKETLYTPTQEYDSGVDVEPWNPLGDEFLNPRNNITTADDDLDVAISGYKLIKEPCAKFQLYGSCPKGQFCPDPHLKQTYAATADELLPVPYAVGKQLPLHTTVPVQVQVWFGYSVMQSDRNRSKPDTFHEPTPYNL